MAKIKNFVSALAFVVFIAVFLFAAGCVQEKQWPVSPTPFVASVAPAASTSASLAPTVSYTPAPTSSHSPTPAASQTPTPVPSSSAPSCLLTAAPNSFVGPATDVVLAAAFNNLPSGVSSATLKCFSSDPGQVVSIGSQGGAFRSCAYPAAPIGGVSYEASATAGGVSCTAPLTNGYNGLAAPVISSVVASVTVANASVTWYTDVTCGSGVVEYGASTAYGTNVTNSSVGASNVHFMFLNGLAASTLYYYRVWSCATSNGLCSHSDSSFTTSAPASTWSFTATPASFGPWTLNKSTNATKTQDFTVTNTGNQALSGWNCSSGGLSWVTTSSCPAASLAAGESATVTFNFNATGQSNNTYAVTLTFLAMNATQQTSSGSVEIVD